MPVLRVHGDGAVARFSATLVASNVRNALAYLLSLTTYRFIAIFTFQDGLAHAVITTTRKTRRTSTPSKQWIHQLIVAT